MNVFLVGNGLDLHHHFPTKYINFLNTVHFLIENYEPDKMDSVGKVFGDERLQKVDLFIEKCYEQHKRVYDLTPVNENKVNSIIEKTKNNKWYNYLYGCFNKDIGWIDFETEIAQVIVAFKTLFESCLQVNKSSTSFEADFSLKLDNIHIIDKFDFFFEGEWATCIGFERITIIDKYVTEEFSGSCTYKINTKEVISELYSSLRELADALKLYLEYFVDTPTSVLSMVGNSHCESISEVGVVYSFNYTHTFQILHKIDNVCHIHGDVRSNIVLGVNPDETDELGDIDTSFLKFKKYFQRVFFKTDISFLKNIYEGSKLLPEFRDKITLHVIGHSLDKTDADIIKQIFDLASEIKILYHNDTSTSDLIKNIVELYGKKGFDELRSQKVLRFIELEKMYFEYDEEKLAILESIDRKNPNTALELLKSYGATGLDSFIKAAMRLGK